MSKHYGSSGSDNWLEDLEKQLDKSAVQPMQDSIFNQINDIMNGGAPNKMSKFNNVNEVVEDMMARSGLTAHLSKTSLSKKVEKDILVATAVDEFMENFPQVEQTIDNIISSTRGNLSVPAIIDKLRSIHQSDVKDDKFWGDDRLIINISKKNLLQKSKFNYNNNEYHSLGKIENGFGEDSESWNTDAFYGVGDII